MRDDFKPIFKRITSFYKIEIENYDFLEFCDSFKNNTAQELETSFTKLKLVDFSTSRKDEMLPAIIRELSKILNGDEADNAILAWDNVLYAMDRYGAYHSVAFKDRAIMKAIESIGGWIELNKKSDDELKWAKKEFIQAYKAFSGKTYSITHLTGITEQGNRLLVDAPKVSLKLIGYQQPSCTLDSYLLAMEKQKPKTVAMVEATLRIT